LRQNIYDDPKFFDAYENFRLNDAGFNRALEQPSMQILVPSLRGKSVLDIGCGHGVLCRYAAVSGAADVIGVDCSERMLTAARRETVDDGNNIRYVRAFAEDFDAVDQSFHIVVSSLTFHYVEDLANLLSKIHRWLKPAGTLSFSVEHPIYSAAGPGKWINDSHGRTFWGVANYFDEGARATNWLGTLVIKYHRAADTLIELLIRGGFSIAAVLEPRLDHLDTRGEAEYERSRPAFLLIQARKID
jgi:ubiquinone/menaquinone biosynthesis C-methylase UbiE